eukprot:UN2489
MNVQEHQCGAPVLSVIRHRRKLAQPFTTWRVNAAWIGADMCHAFFYTGMRSCSASALYPNLHDGGRVCFSLDTDFSSLPVQKATARPCDFTSPATAPIGARRKRGPPFCLGSAAQSCSTLLLAIPTTLGVIMSMTHPSLTPARVGSMTA